jgi:hypothetical protein
MWRRLSIRWQLILLLTLVLSVVSAGTLGLTYGFDVKERKLLALEQVDTLGRALQHDLVLALVNPQADVYADISFRLSGFDSVAALAVLDADGVEVYRHVRSGTTIPPDLLQRSGVADVAGDQTRFFQFRVRCIGTIENNDLVALCGEGAGKMLSEKTQPSRNDVPGRHELSAARNKEQATANQGDAENAACRQILAEKKKADDRGDDIAYREERIGCTNLNMR